MSTWRMMLYFALASVFCYSTLFPPDPYSWLLKISPIVVLIITAFKQSVERVGYLFLLGLIASACGDFLLHYDRENWFIFGLAAFFVAHIFYLLALMPFKQKQSVFSVIYLIYGAVMVWLFWPNLAELKVPVIGYMAVLLFMAIGTLLSKKSNLWLILGGGLFVISDSLIGIDKFYQTIPYSHLMIMVTYYLAQLLLFVGIFSNRAQQQRRIFS